MRDYKRICDNIENVENYEKALVDNFEGWYCYHRLETHTSDGERRLVDLTREELKVLGMYYNRPPEELIFLTAKEHHSLHNKGKSGYWEGKRLSDETKKKLSNANKGRHLSLSEEAKIKISEVSKGKHWYNNGTKNIRAKECPEGFVPGRLK